MSFQDLEAGRPLASRRDRPIGKQDSTQAIASGIFQINTAVSTFQRLVNTLGTPKDTPELREKLGFERAIMYNFKAEKYDLGAMLVKRFWKAVVLKESQLYYNEDVLL
ncbi:Syntaxin-22 [Morella rubra]|uniref:Syntaxin-22 n=1 Tax=Morella rubra TaxID=262757 RepID=A0A6A1W8K8_9ROSI|nr:Syntaxin-22 [Morella rubra]